MLRPSKSERNTAFGTDNIDEVIEFILVNGKMETHHGIMNTQSGKGIMNTHAGNEIIN
jgi:ribosome maturation protein Sdo1